MYSKREKLRELLEDSEFYIIVKYNAKTKVKHNVLTFEIDGDKQRVCYHNRRGKKTLKWINKDKVRMVNK